MFGPQLFSAWLLSVGSAAALAEVAMCQGGACTRNGGPLLLDAAAVLLSKHTDQVKVMNFACSNECPAKGCVATPNRGVTPSRTLPTGDANSALSSASEIVHEAGFDLDESLKRAFLSNAAATALLEAGDAGEAEAQFSAALAEATDASLAPAHAPIEGEPAVWEASVWRESLFDAELRCDDSATAFEFGTCSGGELQLIDVVVDGVSLSGEWEGDLGEGADAGTFQLNMRDDGRGFLGVLTSESGGQTSWKGRRVATTRTRRTERPPWGVRWVYSAFQGRSRARLAIGDKEGAVEDAKAAVALCCRAPAAYSLLAEVAGACGEEGLKVEAEEELAWLRS